MRQPWLTTGPLAPRQLAAVLLMLVGAAVPSFAATVTGLSLPPAHATGGEECSEDVVTSAPATRSRTAVTVVLAEPAPNRLAFGLAPGGRPRGSLTPLAGRGGPPPHHIRC